jgi:hypothetical protein
MFSGRRLTLGEAVDLEIQVNTTTRRSAVLDFPEEDEMSDLSAVDFVNAVVVWSEDDATVNDPDHEFVWDAYKRLYGGIRDNVLGKQDKGDVIYYKMPDDVLIAFSYPPGDGAIYDFKNKED